MTVTGEKFVREMLAKGRTIEFIVGASGWSEERVRDFAATKCPPTTTSQSAEDDDQVVPLRNLVRIPISRIEPHPQNVRADVGDITDLAQSIAEVGLIQPLTVVPNGRRFRIIAGHRRFAACKIARQHTVPCVVRADLTGQAAVEAMIVENLHRVDLSPLEEAKALRRLVDEHHYSQDDIAMRIGRSNAWVSTRLILLTLPAELQGRLTAKEITVTRAIALAKQLQGRAPGDVDRGWDRPHLDGTHPLAERARSRCEADRHGLRRRIGNVACGECWEAEIRLDERAMVA